MAGDQSRSQASWTGGRVTRSWWRAGAESPDASASRTLQGKEAAAKVVGARQDTSVVQVRPGSAAASPLAEGPSDRRVEHAPQPAAMSAKGWEMGLPPYIHVDHAPRPLVIAVGGGKGGVGKSMVSANLAARCAGMGINTLAIDLDIGGSNLHTSLGLPPPPRNLADVVLLGRSSLKECVVQTSVEGLKLIAGGRDEYWGAASALEPKVLGRIAQHILAAKSQLGVDLVILDLGAGCARHTVDFFSLAQLGVLTVLAEPTSIENAYLFLRTYLLRVCSNVGQRLGAAEAAEELKNQLLDFDHQAHATRSSSYPERMRHLSHVFPGLTKQLALALRGRQIGIVVNQVRGQKDVDVGASMEVIGERYFGLATRFLGYLPHDEAAWKSLRNQRLMLVDFPASSLARRINELALQARALLGL